MPALLRQQYRDSNNNIITRDINLDLELVRPLNSKNIESKIYLFSDVIPFNGHMHHMNANAPHTTRSTLPPQEAIELIIDGKRTGNLTECYRTRLSKGSNSFKFQLENIDLLQAEMGDPIVVLDNIKEPKVKLYGIIKEMDGEEIHLHEQGESVSFFKGAIVQNLSNRWHTNHEVVGSRSQLQRPDPINFIPFRKKDRVELAISVPPTTLVNTSVMQYFDVYVRNKNFTTPEFHWIPDATDLPADTETFGLETYNGGTECAGGFIRDIDLNKNLYVGIIVKNKTGFYNVDESACTVIKAD